MKNTRFLYLFLLAAILHSCVTTKEVRYVQPSESLSINEEGLVPYSVQPYRVVKGDILNLNIVTTPKGDAAQFYSRFNTSGGENSGSSVTGGGSGSGNMINSGGGSASVSGNSNFYFNGLKVDANGNINVFGIGDVKAEGRTLADIANEIQEHVNENFLNGKSQVRLDTDGITYYILGDIETTGLTGEKKSYNQRVNIFEAIAANGGMNKTIDRKNITVLRKFPEGIKKAKLDLTREDVMNSQYFWLQNGDMIVMNTRAKSIYGFGKEPLQALTTGVSLLTTALSIYLIVTKL